MKHAHTALGRSRTVALTALIGLLAGAAHAQSPARDDAPTDAYSVSLSYAEYLAGTDVRVSELVGMRIVNAHGENLGEIEDVIVGAAPGADLTLIVSVGVFLDVGDKLIATPLEELRISPSGDDLYLDRTEEQLTAEPAFAYEDRGGDRAAARSSGAATASGHGYRVAGLIGATVVDSNGEEVGEIDDLVVGTQQSEGTRAVLSIGGFAGIGDKLVAVPFDELQVSRRAEEAAGSLAEPRVRIGIGEETLMQMPEFEYDERDQRTAGPV